ncbi:hypothetical protein IPA_07710 [Ignicoccus pacificus DSM 13166]|uniref:Pterin-binding domain-containing protein n=1 Tax=Ignicoccus pacificus DSM 13166 TaxID=940294 RepID=A0A977PLV8_9CREN|nr:hypothetical protein IPA_07710 [Ignicoccus pacificus DSM 13166]
MKRILIPTSKRLEEVIRSSLPVPEGYEVEVWGLPIDVVALLRPRSLVQLLKMEAEKRGTSLDTFDYILVSGMIPGDMREVEKEIGVPVYKGTRTLSELKALMKHLPELEERLSPLKPLEEELRSYLLDEFVKELNSISFEEAFSLGPLKVPKRGPPFLLGAEVLENEPLEEKLHKASQVADFVIIGSSSISPDPSKVPSLLKLAEKYFKVIAFDSMFAEELNEACSKGADLVLSLDEYKAERVKCEAAVVIPGNSAKGYWPLSAREKVESLKRNLEKAKESVEKVLVDPVLSPPWNLLESLIAYKELSALNYPMMMGLSNVVELVDFDSPGVNSLLVTLAAELGVSVLMVTEHSDKCLDSWYEVKVASAMASVAKNKGTLPKDLGMDMLIVKEKRREELKFEERGERIEVKDYSFPLEDSIVRIWVDGSVKVNVEKGGKIYHLEGDPYLIGKTLVGEGLVNSPSHAFYLGWELHKAFIAKKLNKGYVQERPLKFEGSKEKWEELRRRQKRPNGMT